jgi:hypothetical protein
LCPSIGQVSHAQEARGPETVLGQRFPFGTYGFYEKKPERREFTPLLCQIAVIHGLQFLLGPLSAVGF